MLMAASSAVAQTNTPPPSGIPVPVPDWLVKAGEDVGAFFKDAQPYFTNNQIRLGGYGAYIGGHPGGIFALSVPVSDQVSLGIAGAYLHNTWYDASLGINFGVTKTLPLVGDVRLWAETGPGYNFHSRDAIAQSATGATKKWSLFGGELAVTAGALNISDISGMGWLLGGSYNLRF